MHTKRSIDYKLFAIMIIAILSRIVLLREYPGGIHADEAFAGYEAYSMANYGTDSWGYVHPVYLTAWGSGMSVLESYFMLPFIKCFGLNSVTVKIPQALLGILTIYIFFLMGKKISNKNIAYWGCFLLAISPWHIMISRYGMDCNIAPAFILIGIYFAICGIDKNNYLLISAVFWGLSLYAYAVNWLFVPAFLIGCLIYCMKYKKITWSWQLVCAGVIVFLFAVPLLLFVAVNNGLIPEIKSAIISIPRLVVYRGSEISIKNIPDNIIKLLNLFLKQNDHLLWNCIREYGVYYLYSTPFVLYGGFLIIKTCINNAKQKKFGYEFIIIWWTIVGVIVGLIQGIGLNRINCVILAMFVFLAKGISDFYQKCEKYGRRAIISVYLISFALFEICYFTRYQVEISNRQNDGAKEAIEYAMDISGEKDIFVESAIRHSQVLFYTGYPTPDYIASVEWNLDSEKKRVFVKRFGQFCWDWDVNYPMEGVYIISADEIERFEKSGYDVIRFDSCAVAKK